MVSKNVRIPAHQFWGNGLTTNFYAIWALQGLEPYATWQKIPPESLVEPFTNPKGYKHGGSGVKRNHLVCLPISGSAKGC